MAIIMDKQWKEKRKEKEEQYHYTDSIALFFTKDELQLHVHMPTSFEGKSVIQQTFLNYQHGINFWHPEKKHPDQLLLQEEKKNT